MTDAGDAYPLASTSDNEQIPGGASLSRDLVSLPQPPIGLHTTRELSFGERWKEVVSDPGPRTPEGTGGACGVWHVAWVWRCAAGL